MFESLSNFLLHFGTVLLTLLNHVLQFDDNMIHVLDFVIVGAKNTQGQITVKTQIVEALPMQ